MLKKKNRQILATIATAVHQNNFLHHDIQAKTKIVPLSLQIKLSEQIILLAEILGEASPSQEDLNYASDIAQIMLQHFPADQNARMMFSSNKKPKANLDWVLTYLHSITLNIPKTRKWHVFVKNDGKVLGGEYDAQYNVPANYIV